MNDELKKQIAEIELEAKKRIEEVCKKAMEEDKKQGKAWIPTTGERVWFWTCGGVHFHSDIYDIDKGYLNGLYEIGELFPTKEACEEAHRAKVIQAKWKRLAAESGENENPWDKFHEHWCVQYDTVDDCLSIDRHSCYCGTNVYFSSYTDIKNAINEIGEDNVKRYILGIKGE